MRDYLTTDAPVPFAPDNVTVLADGVEGAQPATLAAIRSAFADLTDKAQPGDFIYLHFSGHGTQAPATEIPTASWTVWTNCSCRSISASGTTASAQSRTRWSMTRSARMIDALRAKGADVWVVFDSCHSGTATRAVDAGDDDVRTRSCRPDRPWASTPP